MCECISSFWSNDKKKVGHSQQQTLHAQFNVQMSDLLALVSEVWSNEAGGWRWATWKVHVNTHEYSIYSSQWRAQMISSAYNFRDFRGVLTWQKCIPFGVWHLNSLYTCTAHLLRKSLNNSKIFFRTFDREVCYFRASKVTWWRSRLLMAVTEV